MYVQSTRLSTRAVGAVDPVAPQRPQRRSLRSPELHRRPRTGISLKRNPAPPATSPSCGQQPLHHPGGPSRSRCAAPESSATTRQGIKNTISPAGNVGERARSYPPAIDGAGPSPTRPRTWRVGAGAISIVRHRRSPRPPVLHRRPNPQLLKWNRRRRPAAPPRATSSVAPTARAPASPRSVIRKMESATAVDVVTSHSRRGGSTRSSGSVCRRRAPRARVREIRAKKSVAAHGYGPTGVTLRRSSRMHRHLAAVGTGSRNRHCSQSNAAFRA